MCSDLGMVITSTHSGINVENAPMYAEKAAEAGLEYIVLPSFNGRPEKTLDDFKKVAHEMNQIGEITKKAGITFGTIITTLNFSLWKGNCHSIHYWLKPMLPW
jgi:hypothetical protein